MHAREEEKIDLVVDQLIKMQNAHFLRAGTRRLEENVEDTLVEWQAGNVLAVRVDAVPVDWTTTDININLRGSEPSRSLPEEASEPEEKDDWESEVELEESLNITDTLDTKWPDSDVELSNKDDNDHDETAPRTVDTTDGLEWNLVNGVTVIFPCASESDVCKADRSPGEESSETRQGKEPLEDERTSRGQINISQKTEGNDGDGGK